jgi:serine/threonine protein kinase
MHVTSGSRLGPYEIVSRLGAGGMGEVWSARDTRLDRRVAVKILPAELAHDAQFKLRFEREARTISQLSHPNICTLFDVGDDFLVMELLEGETLADRVARGPMPISDILRYGLQIAEALGKAHRMGIVHRDLKPANVMVTKGGAKLLDFGLAKSAVEIVNVDGATQHKALTQEGTILGTFQYMAPEQLEGQEADSRTDIFALGALLYEMATGRHPFQGKTRTSLIAQIVSADPKPLRDLAPLTPPAFEHVVARCLRKDPDERWQSAHDIAEELRWIAEAGSQVGVAAPLTARRARRTTWALTTIAILAVVGRILPGLASRKAGPTRDGSVRTRSRT